MTDMTEMLAVPHARTCECEFVANEHRDGVDR
jgi:hypothetical protein